MGWVTAPATPTHTAAAAAFIARKPRARAPIELAMPNASLWLAVVLCLVRQPEPGGARDAEQRWEQVRAEQAATWDLYRRPEYQPDATPPENAPRA